MLRIDNAITENAEEQAELSVGAFEEQDVYNRSLSEQ